MFSALRQKTKVHDPHDHYVSKKDNPAQAALYNYAVRKSPPIPPPPKHTCAHINACT